MIYDCFVLNEKAKAIYYHGSQPVLKMLNVTTVGTEAGKSAVVVEPGALEGAKRYVQTKASASALTGVTFGTAITPSAWTELAVNGGEVTPASGDTVARVVEVDGANKPIAMGDAVLNIG